MADANPRMLVVAREARGIGQADIANRLSVNQATISRMEGGVAPVSDPVLAGYAQELDFPHAFFKQQQPLHGAGTDAFHQMYRRRQALPAKSLKKVEADVNIVRMHIARLLDAVESTSSISIPKLDISEYGDRAERVAEAVRAAWQLPSGPIENMTALIEAAGGIVIRMDFGTNLVDATSIRYAGLPPLFFVNENLLGDRLRFTLAHELGHMVMHEVPASTMENEADAFASEFLMPARDISSSLNRLDLRKAALLKPYWKVSMAALVYRAKTLGKITESQYRRLWTQMGAAEIRLREPMELDIPVESPSLHKELIDLHVNELKYSTEQLSELLLSCVSDVRRLHRIPATQVTPGLRLVERRA